jgi:glycosyltransferase involved in cell wall biosynthesis
MCVKNEQEKFRETLSRVIHIADELVVGVDKTSDPEMLTIVERYRDKVKKFKVYRYKWQDDFSKMRNECLAKATQDWILMLDGHDYMTPRAVEIANQVANNLPEQYRHVRVVDAVMQDPPHKSTGTTTQYQRPVMFKRVYRSAGKKKYAGKDGVKFNLPIHNVIQESIQYRMNVGDMILEHRQPPKRVEARKEQRGQMNIEGLRKRLEDDPTDTRSMFYLARTLEEQGEVTESLEWFQKHIDQSGFGDERYQSRIHIALAYFRMFDDDGDLAHLHAARDVLFECTKDRVQRNDHWLLLGDAAKVMKLMDEAALYYRIALSYERPKAFLFIVPENFTWLPLEKLADAYSQAAKYPQALDAIQKAMAHRPNHQPYYNLKTVLEKYAYGQQGGIHNAH